MTTDGAIAHNLYMSKWKIGCLGLAAVLVVMLVAGGWWVYRMTRGDNLLIRNDTPETIVVASEELLQCVRVKYIGPGETVEVKRAGLLCENPTLAISGSAIGRWSCDWDTAKLSEPVVVGVGNISCLGDIPPTPISPPRAYPSPTPDR